MSKRIQLEIELQARRVPLPRQHRAAWEAGFRKLGEIAWATIAARREQQEKMHGQAEPAQHIPA